MQYVIMLHYIARRRENMVGVSMVLAEYHQIKHGYYEYMCYLLFEGVSMAFC